VPLLDSGATMAAEALAAVEAATAGPSVLLSPVSAWEIGLLVAEGRITLDLPGVRPAPPR
jgi:PIN domain nuclease of toxin-antitoxin system